MKLVKLFDDDGTEMKDYLLPDSRINVLIDYLKAVKQDDFNGTWSSAEQTLFKDFSANIVKDGK